MTTRQLIEWPKQFSENPEFQAPFEQLSEFIRSVENDQGLRIIDKTITLSGTTTVEFIESGSVYVDGYIAGTAVTFTIGDSDDADGLLTSQSPGGGVTRFDGAYMTTKHEVPADNTVTVVATGTETVRVVVMYYSPRL